MDVVHLKGTKFNILLPQVASMALYQVPLSLCWNRPRMAECTVRNL